MAIRTTPLKVQSILVGHYDGTSSLVPFIETASLMVNKIVTCMAGKSLTAHDSDTLEMIERYLAAHFYTHSDKVTQSESKGKASGSYQGQTGKGLESSDYGQTALILDDSGCLKSIAMGARVGLIWLGKPRSEQIDHADRD